MNVKRMTKAELKAIAVRTREMSEQVREALYAIGFKQDKNLTVRGTTAVTILGHHDGIFTCLKGADGAITRYILHDAADIAWFVTAADKIS